MRNEQVTCDGCGADLTTRSNCEDYRLVVTFESKPGYGAGVYTAMAISPPVDRTYHFCGLTCLDRWRDHERVYGAALKGKWAEWKDTHGRKGDWGYSYPSPPDDVYASWLAEGRAKASEAFPLDRKKALG